MNRLNTLPDEILDIIHTKNNIYYKKLYMFKMLYINCKIEKYEQGYMNPIGCDKRIVFINKLSRKIYDSIEYKTEYNISKIFENTLALLREKSVCARAELKILKTSSYSKIHKMHTINNKNTNNINI